MAKFLSLPDDYCDESEAEMTEQEEESDEDAGSSLGEDENDTSMLDGEDFISPQMRDFIVPGGETECWGKAIYEPPEDLQHLVSSSEKNQLLKEGRTPCHVPPVSLTNATQLQTASTSVRGLRNLAFSATQRSGRERNAEL